MASEAGFNNIIRDNGSSPLDLNYSFPISTLAPLWKFMPHQRILPRAIGEFKGSSQGVSAAFRALAPFVSNMCSEGTVFLFELEESCLRMGGDPGS